jgi:hypothetical protein
VFTDCWAFIIAGENGVAVLYLFETLICDIDVMRVPSTFVFSDKFCRNFVEYPMLIILFLDCNFQIMATCKDEHRLLGVFLALMYLYFLQKISRPTFYFTLNGCFSPRVVKSKVASRHPMSFRVSVEITREVVQIHMLVFV